MGSSGFNILTLALSAFAFRGVAGMIGAVGLWQGKRWGYYSAVLTWGFILVTGASSLIRFFVSEMTTPLFSDLGNNFLYLTLSRPAFYSILAVISLFILLRDLFLRKGGEKKGSIVDAQESTLNQKPMEKVERSSFIQTLLKIFTGIFIIAGFIVLTVAVSFYKSFSVFSGFYSITPFNENSYNFFATLSLISIFVGTLLFIAYLIRKKMLWILPEWILVIAFFISAIGFATSVRTLIVLLPSAIDVIYKAQSGQLPPEKELEITVVNWKHYSNNNLGISLQHPPEWAEPIERVQSTRKEVEFNNRDIVITRGTYYNQGLQRNMTYAEYLSSLYPQAVLEPNFKLGNLEGKKFITGYSGSKNNPQEFSHYVLIFPMGQGASSHDILIISYRFSTIDMQNRMERIISTISFSPNVTTNQITNWKTYINAGLLFSFRYPKEAQILESVSQEISSIKIKAAEYNLEIETKISPDANIDMLIGKKYASLDSCPNIKSGLDSTPIGDNNLTFSGITAKYYSYRFCSKEDDYYHFVYILAWKDRVFTIQQSFFTLDDPQKISDQILSTIKFL
jgi:hypothetical protein